LLLTHPLVKGSEDITFKKPDGTTANTAPFVAITWDWAPSANYTFAITDNVVNIHLGDASVQEWQAQFRLVPTTPVYLVAGTSYKVKAKVKTSKSASVYAKMFDGDDDTYIDLVARQTVNSTEGVVFEQKGLVPPGGLSKIFQYLFDFAPGPADLDIEISDIVICGEEYEFPEVSSVALDATSVLATSASATVQATAGTYPVDKIRFTEGANVITLNKTADNKYALTGLTPLTAYSFSVTAIDTRGAESAAFATKLEFTTPKLSSIDEIAKTAIGVYPLPIQDVFHIKGINASTKIRIVDIAGKTVLTQWTDGKVNASGLASGIYILYVENQAIKIVKK
jgi:hypothetical protein